MKERSQLLFFLICWLVAGGTIFTIHLLGGDVTRRDITEGVGRGLAWGLLIAAVPVAIQGSLRKARKKSMPTSTTHSPPNSSTESIPRASAKKPDIRKNSPPPPPPAIGAIAEVPNPDLDMNDDLFYEEVAREIEIGALMPGVWTRAFAEADGEDNRARALYIKYRVSQLATARDTALAKMQRDREEIEKNAEAERYWEETALRERQRLETERNAPREARRKAIQESENAFGLAMKQSVDCRDSARENTEDRDSGKYDQRNRIVVFIIIVVIVLVYGIAIYHELGS